jgi:hypothetical protein
MTTLTSSGCGVKAFGEALQRDPSGDQPAEPAGVGFGEGACGGRVVGQVGVDGADDYVVLQDDVAVKAAGVDTEGVPGGGDAGEADDAVRCGVRGRAEHDGAGAGGLYDDVRSHGAARHRVRAPHHPNYQVAGGEAAVGRGVADAAEGFVANDEPLVAGWGPAVVAGGDLLVGAAHPHGQPVDEQVTVARLRVGYVGDGQGVLLLGYHGQGAHQCSSPSVVMPSAALRAGWVSER